MSKIHLSRFWIIPVISALATVYFAYHAVEGNRGIKRRTAITLETEQAQHVLDDLIVQKTLLTQKVHAMSQESLDLDQLEESALRLLNMGDKDVRVIFDTPDSTSR